MVQCFDCKKCVVMINKQAIICIDDKLQMGYRLVHWSCAADEEDPCTRFERREDE